MIKEIEGYKGYYVDTDGNIYSDKQGYMRKLNPYSDTKGRYLMIRLIRDDGVRKSLLVHRIVAQTFIPNPDNLPEVNHKDNNPQNPKADNLEWITRKENLLLSYKKMSPVRNRNSCVLYKGGVEIGKFDSILAAVRFAQENYGAKAKQLEKNLINRDIVIIPNKQTRKNKAS